MAGFDQEPRELELEGEYEPSLYGRRTQRVELEDGAYVAKSTASEPPSRALRQDADSELRAEIAASVLARVMGGRYQQLVPETDPARLQDSGGEHWGEVVKETSGVPSWEASASELDGGPELDADLRAAGLFDALAGQQARAANYLLEPTAEGDARLKLVQNGYSFPDRDEYFVVSSRFQDLRAGQEPERPAAERAQGLDEGLNPTVVRGLDDERPGDDVQLPSRASASPELSPQELRTLERVRDSGYVEWLRDFLGPERAQAFLDRLRGMQDRRSIDPSPRLSVEPQSMDFSRSDLPEIGDGWASIGSYGLEPGPAGVDRPELSGLDEEPQPVGSRPELSELGEPQFATVAGVDDDPGIEI